MTLGAGTRLGPYEITSLLGAGGMGEVYRARDTRLDRVVAIKVLASVLASDPQLRERFEREARAISSLNHPNICVLHDVGREVPVPPAGSAETRERDGAPVEYLVMEYLEGETVAARLARGAMSVDEVLHVSIAVARALDRAHRQGIVHRDLKPGNVMLVKGEGGVPAVKLLDFGLARLTKSAAAGAGGGNESAGRGLVSLADLATPTMSTPLTMKGSIVGTLQYMAPEQIEGKEIDARTDIFAFGALLFEMLTGQRPFAGKSQASLIGAILDHDPPVVSSLQPATPPLLSEIVRRALAKDPDDRWQSARDVMRQLEWVVSQKSTASTSLGEDAKTLAHSRTRVRAANLSVGLVVGASLAAAVVSWLLRPPPVPLGVVVRSAYLLPDDQSFSRSGRHAMALSPDGTSLVYVANQQLYLRQMNELSAIPIAGTERTDPAEPVFSPDGTWVAFWSTNQLRKVPVSGGTPVTLCAAPNPHGMTWAGERIVFGQNQQDNRGIYEVSQNGGTPTLLVGADAENAMSVHGPQIVEGGRAVVFALRAGNTSWDDASIVVHELETKTQTILVERGTDPHLLPTGHLMFARDGALFAIPFDAKALKVTGGPVPVQEGVRTATGNASGAAHAAFSAQGTFAFIPGVDATMDRTLVWVDRNGKEERTPAAIRNYSTRSSDLRISPDGTKIAVVINAERQSATVGAATRAGQALAGDDIWVLNVARPALTRITFTSASGFPLWTPDSQRLCSVFTTSMFCQPADGSGPPQLVGEVKGPEFNVRTNTAAAGLRAFSPDGKRMLFIAQGAQTKSWDIYMTTFEPSAETRALVHTAFDETGAAISPNGRWVAYQSNESGRNEVYVRPFPDVDGGRWQISTEGGAEPRWAASGRELFFSVGGGPVPLVLWSAAIQPGSSFVAAAPSVVMKFPEQAAAVYDVGRDGRFLFNVMLRDQSTTAEIKPQIVLVQNWFDELRARVPLPD